MSSLLAYTLITAAAKATSANRAMLVELLGDASIDVNVDMPAIGGTALIVACRSKNVDFVRLLLERGADPNTFSKSSHSKDPYEPLVSAVSHARGSDVASKLVALLLAHGAKPTAYALKIAALHGCHDALRIMLLAEPADLTPDDASELLRFATSSMTIETIDVVNAHLRREAPSPGQPRPALQRLCLEEAEHEKSATEFEEKNVDYSPVPSYGHICALAKADDPTVPAFRTRSELVRLILDLQMQVRQASSC
jgi:hypothetical protein